MTNKETVDRVTDSILTQFLENTDIENQSTDWAFKVLGLKTGQELSDKDLENINREKTVYHMGLLVRVLENFIPN